jgi:hypothetical protein
MKTTQQYEMRSAATTTTTKPPEGAQLLEIAMARSLSFCLGGYTHTHKASETLSRFRTLLYIISVLL